LVGEAKEVKVAENLRTVMSHGAFRTGGKEGSTEMGQGGTLRKCRVVVSGNLKNPSEFPEAKKGTGEDQRGKEELKTENLQSQRRGGNME